MACTVYVNGFCLKWYVAVAVSECLSCRGNLEGLRARRRTCSKPAGSTEGSPSDLQAFSFLFLFSPRLTLYFSSPLFNLLLSFFLSSLAFFYSALWGKKNLDFVPFCLFYKATFALGNDDICTI